MKNVSRASPARKPSLMAKARLLYESGLVPVPLCFPIGNQLCSAEQHTDDGRCENPGKRPLLKAYRELALVRPSFVEVEMRLLRVQQRRSINLGVVVPLGRVVVEADSPEADEELAGLMDNTECLRTPVRLPRPGRGRAWIFSVPTEVPVRSLAHRGTSGRIDVCGTGSIFVVPPSSHETGHHYEWAADLAAWEIEAAPLPESLLPLLEAVGHVELGGGARVPVGTISLSGEPSPRVQHLIRTDPKTAALWRGEKIEGDTSRSGVDISFAIALLRRGVSVAEVASALAARPDAHSRKIAYIEATISKALIYVGSNP